jgi:hypothetical protein
LRLIRNGRAVSPVIATLIIVSIAIALAITATLWWSGTIQGFLGVEKVNLILYTESGGQLGTYKVTIEIRNTGTRDITINGVYLNGKPFWEANVTKVSFYIENVTQTLPMAFSLPVGKVATIEVYLGSEYRAGQTIEVKLVTASGNEISKTANLP